MTLPAGVSSCLIKGRFIRAVIDGPDAGDEPDGIPLVGLVVTLRAMAGLTRLSHAQAFNASPPTVIFFDDIAAETDANGVLRHNGVEGFRVVATDDDDVRPNGFTYEVTIESDHLPQAVRFNIAAPAGGEVDLAQVFPVPATPGKDVLEWMLVREDVAAEIETIQGVRTELLALDARTVEAGSMVDDNLILVRSDGSTHDAGNTRGRPGRDGSNVLPDDAAVAQTVSTSSSLTNAALDRRGPIRLAVGETNRTSELKAWISDLHAGRDRGALRPGVYVAEGLVLPSLTTLTGAGGGMARFGANDDRPVGQKLDRLWGAVTIRRPAGSTSTAPLVHLKGPGASLRGVTLDANGSPTTSLVSESFEGSILDVRMIGGSGIAWDITKANNGLMRNILVDNHGSPSLPAVRIRSVPGAGNAAHTNAQLIDLLTIERSANTALQVGELGSATEAVEWLMLRNLHVESPDDNAATPGNAGPLIRVLNVKGVSFFDPLIYGGPGVLLEQDQDRTYTVDPGGVRFFGGSLIGQEAANASASLIRLIRGDNFAAIGTKFMRYNAHAIVVESGFGSRVWPDSTCRFDISGQALLDKRSTRSTYLLHGNSEVRGHLVSRARTPTITAGGGVTSIHTTGCDDTSGVITYGTNGTPTAGGQFEVKFAEPYGGRPPVVTLTAASSAAAALRWHVTATNTGFVARTDAAPPANLAAGSIALSYSVIG